MSSGSEQLHQEAASAGGGDTDFYIAAVGAPPSSRAPVIHQREVDVGAGNSGQSSHHMRQQLGQGVSMTAESSSASRNDNPSGQSYKGHQRQSALANTA